MRFSVRTYAAVALVGVTVSLALLGREFLRQEEPPAPPATGSPARALYDANGATEALSQAKKEQKTLFVWFSAPW